MTDSDPAIRRAEVDNSERPASDYAGRIRSMNDEDAAFEGPPGLCGFRCAQDQASAIAADADARIAELERERDEAVGLVRLMWNEAPDETYFIDVAKSVRAFLAAHPAPTPTTAAEPQNMEQE
jgi:hypothetical protein